MTNNKKRRSPEFPEIRNVGVPEFSGNQITSKYTYLGNSPEFRVVLESCERILTTFSNCRSCMVTLLDKKCQSINVVLVSAGLAISSPDPLGLLLTVRLPLTTCQLDIKSISKRGRVFIFRVFRSYPADKCR